MTPGKIDKNWVAEQVKEYTDVLPRYDEYSKVLYTILKSVMKKTAPMSIIQTRVKSIPSFTKKAIKKAETRKYPVEEFTDLCGARVIVQTRDYIEPACDFIKEFFEIDWKNSLDVSERLKVNEFGYRSIHYIVELKPGVTSYKNSIFDIPQSIFPDDETPMKAEIQIKTLLEHGWAEYSHDLAYKGSFKLPKIINRELAVVSALLESVDSSLSRINDRIRKYTASYDSYMTVDQIKSEIDTHELILEYSPEEFMIASKIGKLAISIGEWQKAIDVLEKYVDTSYQPILRDLGIAVCKLNKGNTESSEYQKGQEYLERAIELDETDVDAISSLAGTWKGIDEDKTLLLYKKALEIDPGDPYVLGNCLEYEIQSRNDATVVSLMSMPINAAINRCWEQAEVGSNYPWAFYDLGKLYLLVGQPYLSMMAYLKAIEISTALFMVETSMKSLEHIKLAIGSLYDWADYLFKIGMFLKSGTDKAIDEIKQSASKGKDIIKGDVTIVVGSCNSMKDDERAKYSGLLIDAFKDYHGTIISGGTKQGISGIVGDLQKAWPKAINTIGYVPTEPQWGIEIDDRYSEIITTQTSEFNPLQSLQYWIDIIAAGIDPKTVKLVGVGGNSLSSFEIAMAIVVGAKVVILERPKVPSELQDDEILLSDLNNLEIFPTHRYMLPAFIGTGTMKLPEEIREKLAKYVHSRYRAIYPPQLILTPESMVDWDDLSDELKESNRLNVDNIVQKLNEIGFVIEEVDTETKTLKPFTDEQIEIMAEMEHARWMAEKMVAGWKYGKHKDIGKKEHPSIVSWRELSDAMKDIDRNLIKNMPWFPAELKLRVKPK
ncbi:hypothetical protein J7L05_04895 [bacterium]|nr:hypothetical protein [bacterium]